MFYCFIEQTNIFLKIYKKYNLRVFRHIFQNFEKILSYSCDRNDRILISKLHKDRYISFSVNIFGGKFKWKINLKLQ